jgi:hypothetical protein
MKEKVALLHSRLSHIARRPVYRAALALTCATLALAQVAPGPLSSAHQQLDGVTKCSSCHNFGAVARGFKCLECHTEIRRRVDAKTGLHGRSYKASADEIDCHGCHKEHNGRASSLIALDRPNFDHLAKTGFALDGKHRQQKCENCHTATRISAGTKSEIKLKNLNRSYLGLRRECTACHEDRHQGQLGSDCLRCHSQDAFKPAPGFSHAGTHYPLTGLHQTLACQKCHGPKPGQPNAQWKGLAHDGCQSCHADPHRGAFQEAKFRGSCDTCHNTNGFKTNHPGTEFNHAVTKFALEGKHAPLACAKCHKSADFRHPIAHERCQDCHQDPHRGQFAGRAAGSDCSACHSVTGFKPSRFDRGTHRQSAFPLEGKHAALRCAQCHQPEGSGAVYISRKLTCPACHADRHGGEFAAAPYANQCDRCHTTAGFQPLTFSAARHAQTQFPLAGKHASTACEKCHKPMSAGVTALPLMPSVTSLLTGGAGNTTPAILPRQYHFASRACDTCHADPHKTKLACEGCHTVEDFKVVRPFEHSTTRFKIEGGHLNVKCIQCHKPSKPDAGGTTEGAPRFSDTPMRCFDCHGATDPHDGQFSTAPREEDCSSCHVWHRWKGENFNHDKTQFVLNRVHYNVECAKCHKDQRLVNGKMIRMYRGTPTECIKCH